MTIHEVRRTLRGDVCVGLTISIQNVTGVIDVSEQPGYPADGPHPNYVFQVDDILLATTGKSWTYQFGADLSQALTERQRFVEAWKASTVAPKKPPVSWWRRRT